MIFNKENDVFNVAGKAEIPYSRKEAFDISKRYEELFTYDYDVDLEHRIFEDMVEKLNGLGYDVEAPHTSLETTLLGIDISPPNQYERNKSALYNLMQQARMENPKDADLGLLPGSEKELQKIKDGRTINRIVAKKFYDQSDYASWGADMAGSIAAQFKDTPMLMYLASIPVVGTGFGLLPTAGARIAAWVGEGMIGGYLIESTQQSKSRELIKKLDLTLQNEEVRQDLIEIGINPDTLNLTQEELDTRLLYSWVAGGILAGGIGVIGEGGAALVKRIFNGDAKTLDLVDDAYHKTSTIMQGPVEQLTPKQVIQHVKKIAQASDNMQFSKNYVRKDYQPIQGIDDIDKAIDDIATQYNVTFTKKQKRNMKGIMDHHNYHVEVHNSVVNQKHLNWDDEVGEWGLKVDDIAEDDIFKNATKAQNDFNEVLKQGKVKLSKLDAKFVKDRFRELGVDDAKKYKANLPKDAEARRQQLLNDNARVRLISQLLEQKVKNEKTNIGRYMSMQKLATDFLEISFSRNVMPGNVSSTQRAIFQDFMNRLDDPKLHKVKWNKIDEHDMDNIVREMYGEATGDEMAGLIAKRFALALEDARTLKNHYGGNIAKLNNYFPQAHNQIKIGKVSDEDWTDFILPKLDTERTAQNLGMDKKFLNADNSLNEAGQLEMRRILKSIHEDITLGSARQPFKSLSDTASIKTRDDQMRYLIFSSADDYLAYAKEYGENPVHSLSKYFNHMSNDIALMKVFGPDVIKNSKGILKFAEDFDARVLGRRRQSGAFDRLFDHIRGTDNVPQNHNWSTFGREMRALLVTAQLGSAYLASLADLSYGYITRSINGMPAKNTINNYVKFMAGNKDIAREARVVGMEIAEEIRANTRIHGEVLGNGPFSWMAQNLMKISLLQPGTIAGRTAFKYEFQFHLKNIANKSFDSLDENIKFMYQRYGITKADHEALAKVPLYKSVNDTKVTYLRVADIEDPNIRQKFYTYMFSETETAVPSYMARSRADMMQGYQPGTVGGEVLRNVFLFKNFPMTILYTQGARAINTMAKHPGHMRYIYPLQGLIMTSIAGYLIMNARNLAQGEDTTTMNPKTLSMGMMYGGGLGIFGDLFLHDTTRYGQTPIGAALGPVFGLANDTIGLLGLKQFQDALYRNKDSTDRLVPNAITFLDRYTPYNNLWYTRAATDRLIFDNLRKSLDPKYDERKRRLEKRLEKEGRSFFIDRDSFKFKRAPKIQLLDWKMHE